MSALNLIFSLTSTNCTPILMYGLEAMKLSNAQINRLLYAYNSVFYKLFRTFNADIIAQTQFYSGYLNLRSLHDLRTVSFLYDLRYYDYSCPASHFFHIGGSSDWIELANKYSILAGDSIGSCKARVWAAFGIAISALP